MTEQEKWISAFDKNELTTKFKADSASTERFEAEFFILESKI